MLAVGFKHENGGWGVSVRDGVDIHDWVFKADKEVVSRVKMDAIDGITWEQIEVVKAEMFNEHYGFGSNHTKIFWKFRLMALDEPGTPPEKREQS